MFLEKVSDKNWQVNKNRNIISSIINLVISSAAKISPNALAGSCPDAYVFP